VYSVYSDNHNVYYSFSRDHGQTWSGPYQVNTGTAATAIIPWSVALTSGKIDIVYTCGTNQPRATSRQLLRAKVVAETLDASQGMTSEVDGIRVAGAALCLSVPTRLASAHLFRVC
jgi:hypothetical protein